MDTLNKGSAALTAERLEDFSLSGIDAEIAYLLHRPAFETLRKRIWDEGFEAGTKKAEAAGLAARRAMASGPLGQLEALLYELKEQRERFLEESGKEVVGLVLSICRKILHMELQHNPDVLATRLQACIDRLGEQSSYRIKVNPAQVMALHSLLALSGKALLSDIPFRLDGDGSVPQGGLVIEGDTQRLEAICSDEMDQLEDLLLSVESEEQGDD